MDGNSIRSGAITETISALGKTFVVTYEPDTKHAIITAEIQAEGTCETS